jgi:hypothetical protein
VFQRVRGGLNFYENPAVSGPVFRLSTDAGLSALGWRAVWSTGGGRHGGFEVAYAWPASGGSP